MTKILRLALTIAPFAFLAGCLNMPTPPSQITGTYTSGLNYEKFACSRLSAELNSLARRENQLVIAQEQRVKTSKMQAFLWGFGQGDGIEASELANVRGEKAAVRHAMQVKGCNGNDRHGKRHAPRRRREIRESGVDSTSEETGSITRRGKPDRR